MLFLEQFLISVIELAFVGRAQESFEFAKCTHVLDLVEYLLVWLLGHEWRFFDSFVVGEAIVWTAECIFIQKQFEFYSRIDDHSSFFLAWWNGHPFV